MRWWWSREMIWGSYSIHRKFSFSKTFSFFFHSAFLFFSISSWIQGSRIMYRKCEREGYNNQVKQIPISTTASEYSFLTTPSLTELNQLKIYSRVYLYSNMLLLRLLRLSRLSIYSGISNWITIIISYICCIQQTCALMNLKWC